MEGGLEEHALYWVHVFIYLTQQSACECRYLLCDNWAHHRR